MLAYSILGRVYIFSFLSILVAAPVALGGNNALVWSMSALTVGVLLIWAGGENLLRREKFPVQIVRYRLPLVCFLAVCFWVFLQSQSIAPANLEHPMWGVAEGVLGRSFSGSSISLNPEKTIVGLMRLVTYGALLWIALQLGRRGDNALLIFQFIGIVILGNALYALYLWSIGSPTLLWFDKWVGREEVTGTFVNRNHFAAYIGLGALIWLAFLERSLRQLFYLLSEVRPKEYLEVLSGGAAGRSIFYFLGFSTLVGALFLSRSRAGLLCFAIGLVAYFLLTQVFKRRRRQSGMSFGVRVGGLGAVVAAVVVMVAVSGGRVVDRVISEGAIDQERMNVYARVVEAIGDAPLVGNGLGVFPDLFPMYRDISLSAYGRWEQAHNTYLELIVELGAPAALLLFIAVGICILRCFSGVVHRKKDQMFSAVAVSVSVMLLLHSFIDFPLQISGITITYMAILGVGVAQSWSSRDV